MIKPEERHAPSQLSRRGHPYGLYGSTSSGNSTTLVDSDLQGHEKVTQHGQRAREAAPPGRHGEGCAGCRAATAPRTPGPRG
eukprot:8610524-Pyramimonas_sp.AAC.1